MTSESPTHIGPYTVVTRLDRSGLDAVYQVTDSAGRKLAVKLYPSRESPDLREFRHNVLATAVRLRHPALVRYEEVGEHEGRVFAAMEFVPGGTLLAPPVPLHTTMRIMRHIAEGLGYLHRQGLAHGCLNPSRVLLTASGDSVKLSEAGMCTETRPAALEATASMQVARHGRYLAPELLRLGGVPDARSDIYSFGVLFYELIAGKLPAGRFSLPSQESDEVPPELDEVILRCLRQDAAARYATAADVIAAIDDVSENLPGGLGRHLDTLTSSARGVLSSRTEARSRGGWLWPALGVAAIAAILLVARACI